MIKLVINSWVMQSPWLVDLSLDNSQLIFKNLYSGEVCYTKLSGPYCLKDIKLICYNKISVISKYSKMIFEIIDYNDDLKIELISNGDLNIQLIGNDDQYLFNGRYKFHGYELKGQKYLVLVDVKSNIQESYPIDVSVQSFGNMIIGESMFIKFNYEELVVVNVLMNRYGKVDVETYRMPLSEIYSLELKELNELYCYIIINGKSFVLDKMLMTLEPYTKRHEKYFYSDISNHGYRSIVLAPSVERWRSIKNVLIDTLVEQGIIVDIAIMIHEYYERLSFDKI